MSAHTVSTANGGNWYLILLPGDSSTMTSFSASKRQQTELPSRRVCAAVAMSVRADVGSPVSRHAHIRSLLVILALSLCRIWLARLRNTILQSAPKYGHLKRKYFVPVAVITRNGKLAQLLIHYSKIVETGITDIIYIFSSHFFCFNIYFVISSFPFLGPAINIPYFLSVTFLFFSLSSQSFFLFSSLPCFLFLHFSLSFLLLCSF